MKKSKNKKWQKEIHNQYKHDRQTIF